MENFHSSICKSAHRFCVNFSKFAVQKWKCLTNAECKNDNLLWTNMETDTRNEINRFGFDESGDVAFWLPHELQCDDFILLLKHFCSWLLLMRTNNCDIASGRWLHVDSSMRWAKSVNVWKLYRNICVWNDWSAEMKFGKCKVFMCNVDFSLLLLLLAELNSIKSLPDNCFLSVSFSGEMYPIACCSLQSLILPVSLLSTMKIDTFPSLLYSIDPKIK